MVRLYSYSVYLVIFIIPAFFVVVATLSYGEPNELIYILFYLPIFAFWVYIIYQSKRIYYKGSELYLFNLFSNKVVVVKKDQAASIEKRSFSFFRDTGTYKLTYWVSNDKVETIWFAVNGFLDDHDEIMDKINSIN